MKLAISHNTQAILLLTAPLIAGHGSSSSDPLTPGEYKRLARLLLDMHRQPADLLAADAADLLRACKPVIDEDRLQRLLERGFLLSQVFERWQARAIWIVSRADTDYPRRVKARLREDAPAVLYGCGDIALLESGGLAVVGSRQVDDSLVEYTEAISRLAARAGRTIVSGGAKGIDQAAMRGALEAGGKVSGVLADSLERTAMNREHRNMLMDGQLVLISPYDPSAGFNVGNAMQRNKLIYALADASLVVNSDIDKGGTWAGATEQLDKLRFVPVYVRSTGEITKGLSALRRKGAIPWPNPQDADAFEAVFKAAVSDMASSKKPELSLFPNDRLYDTKPVPPDTLDLTLVSPTVCESSPSFGKQLPAAPIEPQVNRSTSADAKAESNHTDVIFARVRELILQLLKKHSMKAGEVADNLNISNSQARAYLRRLVEEGSLEKSNKPVRYGVRLQASLFDEEIHNSRSHRMDPSTPLR